MYQFPTIQTGSLITDSHLDIVIWEYYYQRVKPNHLEHRVQYRPPPCYQMGREPNYNKKSKSLLNTFFFYQRLVSVIPGSSDHSDVCSSSWFLLLLYVWFYKSCKMAAPVPGIVSYGGRTRRCGEEMWHWSCVREFCSMLLFDFAVF